MARENEIKPARMRNHSITIDDRSRIVITDVEDVESFNDAEVILLSGEGAISITGEGLHISRLNLDEGQLVIEGAIGAVEYEQTGSGSTGGFFSKMFK